MNKKITLQFLGLTFAIMLTCWGTCVVCAMFGITLKDNFLLYLPYMLGGLSPTIASYIVLKKNQQVSGFKEWLKNVFKVKTSVWYYLLTLFLWAFLIIPPLFFAEVEIINPIYMLVVLLPVMLIGGGLEEAGWRYILQPELDKKYGFILSSVITAAIWSVWHLPLFYIPGVGQYGWNFGLFAITVLGGTFALGAIRKISGNVFLCVLFHSLFNAGFSVFSVNQTLLTNSISSGILIVVSIIAVCIFSKKKIAGN